MIGVSEMSWIDMILLSIAWVFLFAFRHIFYLFAFLMGRALAETWRPFWHCIAYAVLLGVTEQGFKAFFFPSAATVSGFSIGHFAIELALDTAVLVVIALVAYRVTQAQKMVAQYPWLYQRTGLFGWRELS